MSWPLFKNTFILKRLGVAIFADITKIVTLKEKLKNEKLYTKTQSISVFVDVKKFDNFGWKNADVSRNKVVCHMIHIFIGSSLG